MVWNGGNVKGRRIHESHGVKTSVSRQLGLVEARVDFLVFFILTWD